jgi:hypothetical protein
MPCSTHSGVLEGISVDVPAGCDNGQVHRQLNLVREILVDTSARKR